MRAQTRTVALDKPCSLCGQPVHHTYQGPIEGICGRCGDKVTKKRRTGGKGACTVVRRVGGGGSRILWFALGLCGGMTAMYFLHPLVRTFIDGLRG